MAILVLLASALLKASASVSARAGAAIAASMSPATSMHLPTDGFRASILLSSANGSTRYFRRHNLKFYGEFTVK